MVHRIVEAAAFLAAQRRTHDEVGHFHQVAQLEKVGRDAEVAVIVLGTGKGLSVLELVEMFEKVTGIKLNYKIVGKRAGDIEKVWADATYANQELGWKATKTLEETLLSAWKWEQHLAGKK